MYILYWLTNPFEFASFMLLPLFFVQVIYPKSYENYISYLRPVFIATFMGIILFTVVIYILEKVTLESLIHIKYPS